MQTENGRRQTPVDHPFGGRAGAAGGADGRSVQPGRHTALVVALAAAALVADASAGTTDVSANWSGYVATGPRFSGVGGTWTIGAARCLSRTSPFTAAAFWVGLGGSDPGSRKIEQIGTAADCNADGSESYYAWYELWPKSAVMLSIDIEAGDRVRAAVSLRGDRVRLTFLDLTSGRRFGRTVAFADPDGSSAEWIGEAPVIDLHTGRRLLPLTPFAPVTFTQSQATAGGRTAPIGARGWHVEAVRLHNTRTRVVPSGLDPSGGRFSLSWTTRAQ